MLIELSNFIFKGEKLEYLAPYIRDQLRSQLGALNIGHKIESRDGKVKILPVKDKKLFISTVKNKILLKETDPRRVTLGRDHLASERLTEEQYDGMIQILNGFFDKTGIECDIKLYEFGDDMNSFSLWRQGKSKNKIFKPTTFPVKV